MLIRTAHIISAAAWVGGSLFYALVLGPLLSRLEEARKISPAVSRSFGSVVTSSAWTLLATGGYMTFDRLQNTRLGVPYAVILALKIALAVWMFLLAGALGRSRGRRQTRIEESGAFSRWRGLVPVPQLILWLGLVVFALSAALTTIYEATGRP